MEIKFIIFQITIIVPFLLGHWLKNRIINSQKFIKNIIRINLIIFEPIIIIWSIWGLKLSYDLIILPISGLLLVVAGFYLGKFSSKILNIKDKKKPTFIISSSLANHGFTMGSFICFLLMGEKGLALSSIFLIYFIPYTFLFIFSYARNFGKKIEFDFKSIKEFFINYQNMPLYSIIMALIIHFINIKRPDINMPIDIFIIITIIIYYFSLGTNFDPGDLKSNLREQGALVIIKFLILPIFTIIILNYINVIPDVKKAIIIQSMMPAAIYSVITAILFDLDPKFASTLFVVNTLIFIIIVLPIFFWLKYLLYF